MYNSPKTCKFVFYKFNYCIVFTNLIKMLLPCQRTKSSTLMRTNNTCFISVLAVIASYPDRKS